MSLLSEAHAQYFRGTTKFGLDADDPEIMESERYHQNNFSQGKMCPVCGEPISNISTLCRQCYYDRREQLNKIRREMALIVPPFLAKTDRARARQLIRRAMRRYFGYQEG